MNITRRARIAAAVLLPALVAASFGPAASATAPPHRPSWHVLHWSNTAPPISLGAPNCNAGGQCIYPWTEAGTTVGDLTGTYMASGTAYPNAVGSVTVSRMDVFSGTVAGCGTGTFLGRATEEIPGDGSPGHWVIVDGYGTGDLATLHGFGTAIGSTTSNGISTSLTGWLDCG